MAKSIFVSLSGNWADRVFEKDYQLMKLNEVEAFVKKMGICPAFQAPQRSKKKNTA